MKYSRSAVEKRNERMHRIFEQGRINDKKNAPLHLFQILTRLTEKVERVNAIQHSGGVINAEDWSELYALTNEARPVLETARSVFNKEIPNARYT